MNLGTFGAEQVTLKTVTVNDKLIHWRSTSTPNRGGYADYRYRPPGPIESSFWHEPLNAVCWLRCPDLDIIQLDLNADIERCDEHGAPLPAPATDSEDFGLDDLAELESQLNRRLEALYKRQAEYDELAKRSALLIARMQRLEYLVERIKVLLRASISVRAYCDSPINVRVKFRHPYEAAEFAQICRDIIADNPDIAGAC